MLSCKDISEVASLAMDETLPLRKRMGMQLHLFICKHYRTYVNQISFIHRAMHNRSDELVHMGLGEKTLSAEAKDKIRKNLNENIEEKE